MSSGWSVDLKGASTATLVELYELLKKSKESRSQAREIQRELVERAKAAGLTTQEIVNALVAGVGKKTERAAIAKEWCVALGLTETETGSSGFSVGSRVV